MYRDLLLNQIPSNKTKHNALLQVNDEYHMLKDLQEKEGLAVEYVYRTPWKALLEEKAMKKYALQLEIALLTMLLVLSSSGAIEKGSSMDKLITVSVTGRKGVLTRKVTLSLLLATLVMLCSLKNLPYLWRIWPLLACGQLFCQEHLPDGNHARGIIAFDTLAFLSDNTFCDLGSLFHLGKDWKQDCRAANRNRSVLNTHVGIYTGLAVNVNVDIVSEKVGRERSSNHCRWRD